MMSAQRPRLEISKMSKGPSFQPDPLGEELHAARHLSHGRTKIRMRGMGSTTHI
jgi:hypothetical protein